MTSVAIGLCTRSDNLEDLEKSEVDASKVISRPSTNHHVHFPISGLKEA